MDKENRRQLLNALKESLNKEQASADSETPQSNEKYDNLPFTRMLRPIENSKFRTREIIWDYLLQAGIPFEFFSLKPIKQTGKNHNPDGFNGGVAAMIHVFKELHYFEKGLTFPEILDAYLKETNNKIGKLSVFKRHYFGDDYFIQYSSKLKDILPKELP